MGELRDRMECDLRLRRRSESTCVVYLRCVRAFAAYHRRSPAELGEPEVRAFPHAPGRRAPRVGVDPRRVLRQLAPVVVPTGPTSGPAGSRPTCMSEAFGCVGTRRRLDAPLGNHPAPGRPLRGGSTAGSRK